MAVEFKTVHFSLSDDFDLLAELKKLADEGWTLLPGAKPVVFYQMQREAPSHSQLKLGIDDSQIHIIRAADK